MNLLIQGLILCSLSHAKSNQCIRRYEGWLQLPSQPDTQNEFLMAHLDEQVFNLTNVHGQHRIISVNTIGFPLLASAKDPRCLMVRTSQNEEDLEICCGNMQCRDAWWYALNKMVSQITDRFGLV
eukprot:Protomagalhaensia_wolfi_Nauph_80__5617@NODE_641_length_2171_cov_2199_051126_g478_i0_p2_GENE_NODE_641_length_2171_cov_2199_051126_g478_i0NODE_641_length_2171_cov_2199_051126_g478_i0_p2_ORF_typecomplete_len125_score5_73GDE_N/PF12439_8/0_12GRDPlike/PF07173_12/0_19PH/PF00169_29/0_21_NODE_641_length_2171_cov_2199_051126_g478_i0220594